MNFDSSGSSVEDNLTNVCSSKALNRTELAFLKRGIDSATASRLRQSGHTLGSLQQQGDADLKKNGLTQQQISALRNTTRPEIPHKNLIKVLFDNIFSCCICHDTKKSVIIHHIKHWSDSHDHRPENLAVLCLEHHDKAHSRSTLTKNLDLETLQGLKKAWESEVATRNTRVILEQSRVAYDAWWYFNHLRLFELAQECGVNLRKLPHFFSARRLNLIDKSGLPLLRSVDLHYMYEDHHCMVLYAYVKEVIEAVLNCTTICNISDFMDRGTLKPTVKGGDLIFIQGLHSFKGGSVTSGRNQTRTGYRRANHVEVRYTFDAWEATSNSAWSGWLTGRQVAGSLVRVASINNDQGILRIAGTVIAISHPFEDAKKRNYNTSPFQGYSSEDGIIECDAIAENKNENDVPF